MQTVDGFRANQIGKHRPGDGLCLENHDTVPAVSGGVSHQVEAAHQYHGVIRRQSAFEEWCRDRGESAMPAHPIANATYLTDRPRIYRKAAVHGDCVGIRDAHMYAENDDVVGNKLVTVILA